MKRRKTDMEIAHESMTPQEMFEDCRNYFEHNSELFTEAQKTFLQSVVVWSWSHQLSYRQLGCFNSTVHIVEITAQKFLDRCLNVINKI